LGERTI